MPFVIRGNPVQPLSGLRRAVNRRAIFHFFQDSYMPTFAELQLDPALLAAVEGIGWHTPTEIQQRAIPPLIEGRDFLGRSQTGTGKTGAFALALLQSILAEGEERDHRIRALVMAPTRELAAQVHLNLSTLAARTELRGLLVRGGEDTMEAEEHALRQGAAWIVATPGRLRDHLTRGNYVDTSAVRILVVDEADEMLILGFLEDLQAIVSCLTCPERQTILFGATLPPDLQQLAHTLLTRPVRMDVGEAGAAETVTEEAWPVAHEQKLEFLLALSEAEQIDRALVFVRTKVRAEKLVARLLRKDIAAVALHSDRPMHERRRALETFQNGEARFLVATDLAARGLDIPGVEWVVNLDVPLAPEDYVHRIGRTGRAGRKGRAATFMSLAEQVLVAKIEHYTRKRLPERRLEGFAYEVEDADAVREIQARERAPADYSTRKTHKDRKKSPFTKGGEARRGFEVFDADKHYKKKAKKRFKMKKRLPHER
ncbi:MAG: DEAD/DEAH box helicase [Sumerlaeia bacterium]